MNLLIHERANIEELTVLNEEERLANLLHTTVETKRDESPDTIEGRREVSPAFWRSEHRLWYAVLEDAIRSFLHEVGKASLKGKNRESAELCDAGGWIFYGGDGVGSFYFVCDLCQLAADSVQRWCSEKAKAAWDKAEKERPCRPSKTSSSSKKIPPRLRSPGGIVSAVSLAISPRLPDFTVSTLPSVAVIVPALTQSSGQFPPGILSSMI